MRSTQYIWLGLTVLIGILWVFIIQNWIFLNLFSALLGQNLNVFLPQISSPSFTILWISCTIALLFWIFTTLNGKAPQCCRSEEHAAKVVDLHYSAGASGLALSAVLYCADLADFFFSI